MSESEGASQPLSKDDEEFQWQCFQAGFPAPVSTRFWFFPEGEHGFASFGSSGGLGYKDAEVRVTHYIFGAVRMPRSGWLNFIRTVGQQLGVTDGEWQEIVGQKEGDVAS